MNTSEFFRGLIALVVVVNVIASTWYLALAPEGRTGGAVGIVVAAVFILIFTLATMSSSKPGAR